MSVHLVRTAVTAFTTYEVEAEGPEDARHMVELALAGGVELPPSSDTGYADDEHVVAVTPC